MAEERAPDAAVDGGDMDCGSGLLLVIREAMAPLQRGGVLEVTSRESSVREDLPAWCRMVGHTLLGSGDAGPRGTWFRIRKEGGDERLAADLEAARRFTWTARVRWTGGLGSRAYARNHKIDVGQSASFETSDAAPCAIELLLAALGGCLASGFAALASRRGIALRNLEVSLRARPADVGAHLGLSGAGNAGIERVEGAAYVDADADDASLAEMWAQAVRRSPVAQTLVRGCALAIELRRAP